MLKATFLGHPLHPQLIVFPLGLLPFSLLMDAMHAATGRKTYSDTAYYTLQGAYWGGWAAAAAGITDYLTIPSRTRIKQVANSHALLNVGMMGLLTADLLLRRGKRSGPLPLTLSAISVVIGIVSSWYGGHLVYEHGVRVTGLAPEGETELTTLPGDETVSHGLEDFATWAMPERGPVLAR